MKKTLKWLGVAVVVLLAIGIIANAHKSSSNAPTVASGAPAASNQPDPSTQQSKASDDSLPIIKPSDLEDAYDENTVSADEKYKGKRYKVAGQVTAISTNFMGDPYITMGGSNDLVQPQFAFGKSASGQLAKLKKGADITLVCEGKGDVAKVPMSGDCRIVE